MKRSQKRLIVAIIGWAFLVLMAAVILLPMIWILISGFKTNSEIFTDTFSLPKEWRISNYVLAWKYGLSSYFINSIFVTAVSTIATIVVSLLASFALTHSRFDFKLKNPVLVFIISGLMLAPQVA
ncbi:MAG: carbohydrate ABC transporter permease, partial [Lachnospiraceae bacterium]|nr:carbohydrate ABC transporter permease [Lachnospiraceae bacterium]